VRLGDVSVGRRLLSESYEALCDKLGEEHEQTREAYERFRISDRNSATA